MKLVAAIFLPALLAAQIDFFGYAETETDQIALNNTIYNFGYVKLRLDMETNHTNWFAAGNLNIQRYFGRRSWDLRDFIPTEMWAGAGFPENALQMQIGDTLYLDNLYVRMSFPRLDVAVGRLPVSLGTGYAWNPLDIFNRKDILDPTYEQPGVMAVRADFSLGQRSALSVILTPAENWKTAAKMIQAKTGIQRFDFTMNWAQQERLIPYWRMKDISVTRAILSLAGGSFTGQIGEFGLWAEGIVDLDGYSYNEWVMGADHTFDSGAYLMVEHLFNGMGATLAELSLDHYLNYFLGESHSLNQDYWFGYFRYPFTDLISLGTYVLFNGDDESYSVNPTLEWSPFEDIYVSAYYQIPGGREDSEYGLLDSAWRLRLRAYF